jgi:hypothetical protein
MAPMRRRYWAERHGFQSDRLDVAEAARLFASIVAEADVNSRLQKWFGYHCVDDGYVPGEAGADVEGFVYRRTRRRDLWPIADRYSDWDESAFFTAVEFLHDHVAEATHGRAHSYLNCGFHASAFDVEEGQRLFRDEVNVILKDYGTGFEIEASGEVVRSTPEEMAELVEQPADSRSESDIKARVADAIRKFRNRGARVEDRRDAVRDLADVMELLQDRAPDTLESADEKDLFHLANKFGIRHANASQKINYDLDIWVDWMFYHYLASIQAYTRLIARQATASARPAVRTRRFEDGQRVRHPRWGEGIVVTSRLMRSDEEVTVAFRDAAVGRKSMLASLSTLELL